MNDETISKYKSTFIKTVLYERGPKRESHFFNRTCIKLYLKYDMYRLIVSIIDICITYMHIKYT